MHVYFAPGLHEEATFLKQVIEKTFAAEVVLVEGEKLEYFKQNDIVGGLEVQDHVGGEFELVLTEREMYSQGAVSKSDDYVYGYASDSGLFYFSVARLRSKGDTPVAAVEIPQAQYEARLAYTVVHELGHWLVKDQRHFQKYTYTNPETGHENDNGWHCINPGCLMRAVDDLAMLDTRLNETRAFCEQCRESLFLKSGRPLLP